MPAALAVRDRGARDVVVVLVLVVVLALAASVAAVVPTWPLIAVMAWFLAGSRGAVAEVEVGYPRTSHRPSPWSKGLDWTWPCSWPRHILPTMAQATACQCVSALVLGLLALCTQPTGAQDPASRSHQVIPGTEVSFPIVFVGGGSSLLGSPPDEAGRDDDEGPQRTVRLDPFWIGIHEVTEAEYSIYRQRSRDSDATADPERRLDVDAVTRPSPPYEDPAHGLGGPDRPATGMTWWAAIQYARWLSLKTGRFYRLPTEAEWEYVCRAGTGGAHPGAENGAPVGELAWYLENSGETLHAVGTKAANPWGVHDMLGNAAEWTLDAYAADAYATFAEDPAFAPRFPGGEAELHTVRGGAFDDPVADIRCADRLEATPHWKRRDPQLPKSRWWNTDSPHVGFRLVSPEGEWTLEEIEAFFDEVLADRG